MLRNLQHGEVGLPAGAWECRGYVGLGAARFLEAEDQHVFREPSLIASHGTGDAEREALLAEQRIPAVAAAVRPDRMLFGEMDDVLLFAVARPGNILFAREQRPANRVQAGDEITIAQHIPDLSAHAGHDAHVRGDIGRICQLDADVGNVGTQGPHAERDHVQRPPAHGSFEQSRELRLHLARIHPIVGGTRILLAQ